MDMFVLNSLLIVSLSTVFRLSDTPAAFGILN